MDACRRRAPARCRSRRGADRGGEVGLQLPFARVAGWWIERYERKVATASGASESRSVAVAPGVRVLQALARGRKSAPPGFVVGVAQSPGSVRRG
jgi:hypothetical protein